jgi:hypothetical protein
MSMIEFDHLVCFFGWKKLCFLGQQVDDEILVQMMVNDEISDSQGIENDSILAGLDFFILFLSISYSLSF